MHDFFEMAESENWEKTRKNSCRTGVYTQKGNEKEMSDQLYSAQYSMELWTS